MVIIRSATTHSSSGQIASIGNPFETAVPDDLHVAVSAWGEQAGKRPSTT